MTRPTLAKIHRHMRERVRRGRRRARRHLLLPASAGRRLRMPQAEAGFVSRARARARRVGRRRAVHRRSARAMWRRRRRSARGRSSCGPARAPRPKTLLAGRGVPVFDDLAAAARAACSARRGNARVRQWVGSILFTLYLFVSVPIYGTLVLLTAPFPRRVTYAGVARVGRLRVVAAACAMPSRVSRRRTRALAGAQLRRADEALVGVGDDRAAAEFFRRKPGC